MKKGDLVLFYHSVTDKQVLGYARVAREAYPDPTATEGDWCCVNLVPVKALKKPVGILAIKADSVLQSMPLVKHTRLSVMPVTQDHFEQILRLAEGTTQ
jgi:predicted RNA-binding protein with PUA-like domain